MSFFFCITGGHLHLSDTNGTIEGLIFLEFYLAVNNLIIDKAQNIFYLIADPSDFVKYMLNKLDKNSEIPAWKN